MCYGTMVREKIESIFTILVFFLLVGSAFAMMPPSKMEARNLEAPLIVVGEVVETGKILFPEKSSTNVPPKGLFVIRILHIVKGRAIVQGKKLIRVLFDAAKKDKRPLVARRIGIPPVKVKTGNFVVVYLKPSVHKPFYQPLAGGASVVVIKLTPEIK